MRWIWDPAKDEENRRNHAGLSFETAQLVFDDPLAETIPDPYPNEERWRTIGEVSGVILFVVHTWPIPDAEGEEVGRIISARKATANERRAYEDGEF